MGIQKNKTNTQLCFNNCRVVLPDSSILSNNRKSSRAQEMQEPPAIQQTRILPSKITPVQNNNTWDRWPIKAAPDVQMAHSVEDREHWKH